ncbi:MAG TPA: diguanylate cyclase [Noviherbaspirillum sp.]
MAETLCILACANFAPEIEAAVAVEAWPDVHVAAFPARCGQPPLSWDALKPLLAKDCTDVAIVGGLCCLQGLDSPPPGWPPVRLLPQEQCFHLVAGAQLVGEAMSRGAYLVTPAWLHDWRNHLRSLGFDDRSAPPFFRESARELVLLDTGVMPDAQGRLAEMAQALGLPASRIAVGIDTTRLLVSRIVMEWRCDSERRRLAERELEYTRKLADYQSSMDFLNRIALVKDEPETIAAIEELFRMLFAAEDVRYVRFDAGLAQDAAAYPPALLSQLDDMARDWRRTDSGTGFLLRIAHGGETLGVLLADRFAFPANRDRYLNLALAVAGVSGLAIANARTFERIKKAEEALRKSEHSLKMAQAVAHLGHWEWDIHSGEMRWSDETYRLLGYEPDTLHPTHELFLSAIHPEDRAKVAEEINKAHAGGRFDLEYRIVLADGRVRVLHGLGEVTGSDGAPQPRLFGTLRDITAGQPEEVLGVIQDITERKELEWKLAEEAHTDALTGCANRRYFFDAARQELSRVRRYGRPMSVLMLDLDHFKSVNDEHGHQVGDRVLQTLVQVCRATLREVDIVGRLGGEEFAILLPETAAAEAMEAGERVRRAVAAADIALENQPPLHITTSVGVATLMPDMADIDTLLARADEALYAAKRAGRNRAVRADMLTGAPS